jgi:hypothetical protein
VLWIGLVAHASAGIFPELVQPTWAELTPQQRQVLSPLAKEWNGMETFRRKTWIGIAGRYESMSPTEQERMMERMREWARLAPEERKQAREKYKSLKRVNPEQRESLRQNWEDYKALPDAEKKRLKDNAARRPPVSTIPPPPASSKKLEKTRPVRPIPRKQPAPAAPDTIGNPYHG